MTLDEILDFCQDDWNLQFTFDYSVFWAFDRVPNFLKIIKETIYSWDCDVEKYLTGETISIECDGDLYAITITFDTQSKAFVVINY